MRFISVLLSAVFALLVWGGPAAADGLRPQLDKPRGDQCVEDPAFMRKNHMNLLRHYRDEAVHQGIRKSKYSLKNCISCHASAETNSVVGSSTAFCQGCHEYAAVHITCFDCHSTKPAKNATYHSLAADGTPLANQLRSAGESPMTTAEGHEHD